MTNAENAIQRLFEEGAIRSDSGTTLDASDGRVANRLRNREKVIDAFVDLVNEGEDGLLDQVVERSGVGRRSVFRYFDDLSDLSMAGFRRVVTEASKHAFYSDPGAGSLQHRIDAVVEVRLRTLETSHAFGLYARRRLSHVDAVEAGLRIVVDIGRTQLAEQFGPELATQTSSDADRLLDNVFVVVSFESYDVLLRQLGRSPEVIASTWRDALAALLAPV